MNSFDRVPLCTKLGTQLLRTGSKGGRGASAGSPGDGGPRDGKSLQFAPLAVRRTWPRSGGDPLGSSQTLERDLHPVAVPGETRRLSALGWRVPFCMTFSYYKSPSCGASTALSADFLRQAGRYRQVISWPQIVGIDKRITPLQQAHICVGTCFMKTQTSLGTVSKDINCQLVLWCK